MCCLAKECAKDYIVCLMGGKNPIPFKGFFGLRDLFYSVSQYFVWLPTCWKKSRLLLVFVGFFVWLVFLK